MLQSKLITREKIREYKQLSRTANDDRLDDVIIQVQIDELRPLLGDKLFNDLMQNPTNYTALLTGGTYTYQNVLYTNYGLYAVLSYYIYAYWTMFGDVTNTPFGTVQKLNSNVSEPVDTSIRKSLFTMNKQSAYNIWLSVEAYLRRTNNPLFDFCEVRKKSFNIRKIGK